MDVEAIVILSLAGLASVGLLEYVYVVLPARLEGRFRESLRAFSLAVELRCPSHHGTTELAVRRSRQVGKVLGMSRRRIVDLEMAAELRDIGLCALPYRLINGKPVSQWSEAEHEAYERHPELSAAMLELVPSLRRLAHIVRTHHVPYDGSLGALYPTRDELSLESRILKVVTDYGWLEAEMGSVDAQRALVKLRGKDFDPQVVDAFLEVLTSEGALDYRRAVANA